MEVEILGQLLVPWQRRGRGEEALVVCKIRSLVVYENLRVSAFSDGIWVAGISPENGGAEIGGSCVCSGFLVCTSPFIRTGIRMDSGLPACSGLLIINRGLFLREGRLTPGFRKRSLSLEEDAPNGSMIKCVMTDGTDLIRNSQIGIQFLAVIESVIPDGIYLVQQNLPDAGACKGEGTDFCDPGRNLYLAADEFATVKSTGREGF